MQNKKLDKRKYVPYKRYYPRQHIGPPMQLITLFLPRGVLEKLDLLVKRGMYPNRSEAIRTFIYDGIKTEVIENE